jgi:hypothetical protein
MYRGTWLVLAVPLLLAAFTVSRPAPLPPPSLPPAFDGESARSLATELSRFYPNRFPGSPGADEAAAWFRRQLTPYGIQVRSEPFAATVAGYGRLEFENLVAVVRGRSQRRIVVTAHRDDLGVGPGANDNASGTAALIELARSYAGTRGGDERGRPAHELVFVSTDGGSLGGVGAARFLESSVYGENVDAVVNLDTIGGPRPAGLQIAGDQPRSPAGSLVTTAAARILEQSGREPRRPSGLRQLLDLAFPFSLYEQAPFVGAGTPALTITTAASRPPEQVLDTASALEGDNVPVRLGQIGRAAQTLVGSLDQGLELPRGSSSYLYLGTRLIRGWAVQLILIAALLPFLAAVVDLFARCRRRRIPLGPALRSYRSRLGFWLFVGGLFGLFALLGVWPSGEALPVPLESPAVTTLPLGGLLALGALSVLAWIIARHRLLPRRVVTDVEQLAGHTAALLALGVISLLVIATNPYALIFLLPSLHAWLWLPQVRDRPAWVRICVLALGFAGPVLLIGSFALRYGLGLDAAWYVAELTALGYVPIPIVILALGWAAAAAQLCTLVAGRYAPYASARERPPRGPLRQAIGAVLGLALGRRQRAQPARAAELL